MQITQKLHPRMSVPDAFHCIVRDCISQIQTNAHPIAAGIEEKWDVEYLHQLRVGLRRLKTALIIFNDYPLFTDDLKKEVTWLEKELGAVRDWDVFTNDTLPSITRSIFKVGESKIQLTSLLDMAENRTKTLRNKATALISSTRYTKLIWQLNSQLNSHSQITHRLTSKTQLSLMEFSNKLLKKRQRRLRRMIQSFADINPALLHSLRIALKKLRYATDFFKSLYPKNKTKKLLHRMTRMQEVLGTYNDICVAKRLLKTIQISHPKLLAETNFASGFLTARVDIDQLLKNKVWKKIITTKK